MVEIGSYLGTANQSSTYLLRPRRLAPVACDKGLSRCTLSPVNDDKEWLVALKARIQRVLDETGLDQKGLSLAAGLSQAHVGMILRGDVGAGVTNEVVTKLAAAVEKHGWSATWLATGHGAARNLEHVEESDPYPERAKALAAAKLLGFDPRDIALVRAIPGFKSDTDLSAADWHARVIRARDERLDDERDGLPAGTTALERLRRMGKPVSPDDPRLAARFRAMTPKSPRPPPPSKSRKKP
jgi:transcriptional regulator with XRE-family HTH domain